MESKSWKWSIVVEADKILSDDGPGVKIIRQGTFGTMEVQLWLSDTVEEVDSGCPARVRRSALVVRHDESPTLVIRHM